MKTKDKPYVDNYPPLRDWLRNHEARCDWQVRIGGTEKDPTAFVESYSIPGAKCGVIVVVHAYGNGWNLYTRSLRGRDA